MNKKKLNYKRVIAVGLALLVFAGGVGVVQNILDNQTEKFEDESVVKVEEKKEKVESPAIETLMAPVDNNIGIVRYYYNKDDDEIKQEQSLILFEGVYRPNQGIDYSNKNESFDVKASISGVVTSKNNDPVLGWTVTIVNDDKISTTYQSLSEVKVEKKQKVKQGEIIGKSGNNIYESDLKNHLHFILQKDDKMYNPEEYIGKTLDQIK